MLSKEKIEYFKERLLKEKKHLEKDLETVGKRNPDVPGDWEPTQVDMNIGGKSDRNDLADTFNELESRVNIEGNLEGRLGEVVSALDRIEKGTYGVCTKTGKPISEERLEVNPAAATCVDHAEQF